MTAVSAVRLVQQVRPARATRPLTKPALKPTRKAGKSARKPSRPSRPLAVMDPETPKLLLSMDEAAYALSCSKKKLYGLINAGEIASFKVGSARRVPVSALERYVSRRVAEQARPTA